jgi:hypothetical protein
MENNRWADAQRLEAWAGEVRVNLVRAVALVAFYGHHLLNVYVLSPDDASLRGFYNAAVTVVVLGWFAAVGLLYWCLSRRWAPPALKYVATGWDLVMLTALLMSNPDGPRSPLMFIYFVIIASAPCRLSLLLVQTTTFAAVGSILVVMWHYVYVRVGSAAYFDDSKGLRIPRATEVIFLLSLGAAGLLAGQVVRQARLMLGGYAVTAIEPREGA